MNCRRLAYLSACGKYLQLLMHGAFWLEPPLNMTLVSNTISSTGAFTCSLSIVKVVVVAYLIHSYKLNSKVF